MTAPSEYPSAGVWRRVAAIVYDCFLLFAVLFVASLIPALLLTLIYHPEQFASAPSEGSVVHELNTPLHGWLYRAYLSALLIGFYTWFWRKSGQTLAMQAWRLKLVDVDGGRPSIGQCLLRLLVAIPALLLGGLGMWWIWLDKQGRSWQDIASNTRLIVLPKQSRGK